MEAGERSVTEDPANLESGGEPASGPRSRGVIFDLDGTLADTARLSTLAFLEVLTHFTGRPVAEEDLHEMLGPNEEGIIRRMVPSKWEACLDAYLAFHHDHYDRHVTRWPEVFDLLETLRSARLPVAIVTARGPLSTRIVLERTGLEQFVRRVICGESQGPMKTAGIRQVLAEWSIGPENAVYVGDSVSDMSAAIAAMVHPIGAIWANHTDSADLYAAGAEMVFDTPHALQAWLLGG